MEERRDRVVEFGAANEGDEGYGRGSELLGIVLHGN